MIKWRMPLKCGFNPTDCIHTHRLQLVHTCRYIFLFLLQHKYDKTSEIGHPHFRHTLDTICIKSNMV